RHGVQPFLDPDWTRSGALVGSLDEDGRDRFVALGSYARIGDSDTAEMAFAVADDEQGRGIGTRLLEQLARAARRHGISRFVADVLATNAAALGVFDAAGFEVTRKRDADEVALRF